MTPTTPTLPNTARPDPTTAVPPDALSDVAAGTADAAARAEVPVSPFFLRRVPSPIGRLEIISDGSHITSLTIERAGSLPHDSMPERTTPVLDDAAQQLNEYFAGDRREFDLPVLLTGTDFQLAVWHELGSLGWGCTSTYGLIGAATGRPTAGRAVGGAVGANPVPIIVGCHRVLASDRRITGYSGGEGIPTKVWLLEHEGIGHA